MKKGWEQFKEDLEKETKKVKNGYFKIKIYNGYVR